MSVKNISTKELIRELFERREDGSITIDLGVIMFCKTRDYLFPDLSVGRYNGEYVGPSKYHVAAESHEELDTLDFDEAYSYFEKLWKPIIK